MQSYSTPAYIARTIIENGFNIRDVSKHCYSRNDFRNKVVPFSGIPWPWTWKWAKVKTLKILRKLSKIATSRVFFRRLEENGNKYY